MTSLVIRLITGATARWVDVDPDDIIKPGTQFVFFANHSSHLDGPVIWASLPKLMRQQTRPVAAKDYWEAGAVRRWLCRHVMKCVLVERKRITKSSNPLTQMEAALDEGHSLIIFPEGTRAEEDEPEIHDFKPGLYHLARHRPAVLLVPVYLENLNRILPKGDFLIIPLLASVRFGRPIRLEDDEEKETFLMRAKQSIESLKGGGHA